MTAPSDPASVPDDQVHALRAFNRFYTRRVGVLDPYLAQDLSLTDVRVLYEIAHAGDSPPVATEIARTLGIDNGYLSRILKRFDTAGWVARTPNPRDARQSLLSLTERGRKAYAPLNARSHAEAAALLGNLSDDERGQLVAAMATITRLLSEPAAASHGSATPARATPDRTAVTPATPLPPPLPPRRGLIRDLAAGDLGWVLQAHGDIYAHEWGLNRAFEALVAGIVVQCCSLDPAKERGWIAEVDGERVGSIFVMKSEREGTAKIRLLVLTENARGLGLGSRLVDECIAFARAKGYTRMELMTQNVLVAARRIYAKRGFQLVSETHSLQFGRELIEERWEMEL